MIFFLGISKQDVSYPREIVKAVLNRFGSLEERHIFYFHAMLTTCVRFVK